MNLFSKINYSDYADQHDLFSLLNIDKNSYGDVNKKHILSVNYSVDSTITEAHPAELDDLVRIHYLIRKFKVITALEIGSGKSTVIIADAIKRNHKDYSSFVKKNLRKNNAFEVHSVETNQQWADKVESSLQPELKPYVHMTVVGCRMATINSRICTLFSDFPNICADFIYLDGPGQDCPSGDIDGISTSHPDRLPMVADLIRLEHFLLPGTIIVTDGRTANARFMKENFQLDWDYKHYVDFDQHVFINISQPLGVYNKRELDFKGISSKLEFTRPM